jgi:hypothetical protein
MLKLLSKAEIATSKAKDRALEVREGMKLSGRVDSLRELAAGEQEKLEKYRTATLSAMQAEVAEIEKKKEAAQANLEAVEEQLKSTLSKTEQKALDDLRKSLEKREKDLKESAFQADLRWIEVESTLKDAENSLEAQKTKEEQASKAQIEAENLETTAKRTLERANNREARAVQFEKSKIEELSLREGNIVSKEQSVKVHEELNLQTMKSLEREKLQVADMRQTLERAMQRIRQNRLA